MNALSIALNRASKLRQLHAEQLSESDKALLALADHIALLDARNSTPVHWRYKLTVEGDNYGLLEALAALAKLIPDSEYEWEVFSDDELRHG